MLTAREILEWDDGAPVRHTPVLLVSGLTVEIETHSRWLRRRLARRTVICDVELAVTAGERIAIIGEADSGKSVLARTLAGLHPARNGHVLFDGRPITGRPRWFAAPPRPVQLIMSDSRAVLDPRLTIAKLVALGQRRRGMKRQIATDQAHELLARVGLEPRLFGARYPHQLSDEQCRRADLARTLALDPAVLIVDMAAPESDHSAELAFQRLVADLSAERDLTCIVMARSLAMIDPPPARIVVLYGGRIVEDGPAAAVLSAGQHPATSRLLATVPQETGLAHDEIAATEGCAFHPYCPFAERICCTTSPAMYFVNEQHRVACHITDARSGHTRSRRNGLGSAA